MSTFSGKKKEKQQKIKINVPTFRIQQSYEHQIAQTTISQ